MRVRCAGRAALLVWLGGLVGTLGGLQLGPAAGLSSPPLGALREWPTWFAARPPVDATFGVIRLLTIGLASYLLAVTVLAVLARLSGDARAVWVVARCTSPGLRPMLFGLVSLSLAAAPAAASADPAHRAGPVMVVAASGPDPPVMRQAPSAPAPSQPAPVPATGRPPPPVAAANVTAQSGDHLWKLAESALATAWSRAPSDEETAPYWLALIERNRGVLVDPTNPDLIYPHQVFQLPPPPDPPPG